MTPEAYLALIGAYLAGSISFASHFVRLMKGIDLRTVGSGNLGATNAARVLGRNWGIVIYVLDFLKGLVPVLIAQGPLRDIYLGDHAPTLSLLMGLAAFVGHCLPVWHNFRGGKGVATASGLAVGLAPWPVSVAVISAFGVGVLVSRTISLGSILAAATLPISWVLASGKAGFAGQQIYEFGLFLVVGLLVIVRHRANMGRLLKGEEPRIGRAGK